MTNTMTPDELAKQYALEYSSAGMDWENLQKAFLAGDSNGYQRGKAEAEKRIWEALKNNWNRFESQGESVSLIEGTEAELKQIIFGGGDVSKTNE